MGKCPSGRCVQDRRRCKQISSGRLWPQPRWERTVGALQRQVCAKEDAETPEADAALSVTRSVPDFASVTRAPGRRGVVGRTFLCSLRQEAGTHGSSPVVWMQMAAMAGPSTVAEVQGGRSCPRSPTDRKPQMAWIFDLLSHLQSSQGGVCGSAVCFLDSASSMGDVAFCLILSTAPLNKHSVVVQSRNGLSVNLKKVEGLRCTVWVCLFCFVLFFNLKLHYGLL